MMHFKDTYRKSILLGSSITGLVITIFIIGITYHNVQSSPATGEMYNEPYVGAMHPHVVSEGPGDCDICGMKLSKLEGHKLGTPLPELKDIYTSSDNMMYLHEGPGEDPNSGSKLIPITESSIYEPPSDDGHDHEDADATSSMSDDSQLYTCGMHPDVIQEGPGTCPICGMDLTPMKKTQSSGTVIIDPVTLQNIGVTTITVEQMDLTTTIRSNGNVTYAEDAEYRVNPKINGWIEKLYVSRTGDMVNSGDPLLEIYSPELVSAQEEYLLALQNSRMLSSSGIDRIKSGASDLLNAARRRLELWDIDEKQITELEQSGKVKRTMTLYSPINGVVLHKNAVEGAAVKAGIDLYRIADLNKVWVEAQVYEFELPWLKAGRQVKIESPYDPALILNGKIDYIYPYLDKITRSANIRIVIPNREYSLLPDMYVDVRIDAITKQNAIAIPKSAVIRSGERDIIFQSLGAGKFLPQEVKLGVETSEYYEVISGLNAGTKVVTSAQFLIDSEAKLQESIQRRLQSRMKKTANS